MIKKDSYPCSASQPTTTYSPTTVFNFSSTDVPITSAKYTSESVLTKTTPSFSTSAKVTTDESKCTVCYWTPWMNVDYPKFGPQGGDNETIKNVINSGRYKVCSNPIEVICQAVRYPGVPLSLLHQDVFCNNSGLICENKDQTQPKCLDFEIKAKCCEKVECSQPSVSSSTSTTVIITQQPPQTATRLSSTVTSLPPTVQSSSTQTFISTAKTTTFLSTHSCVCSWSDWLDFGRQTAGSDGEVIPIEKITDTYPSLCKVPVQVECRAKQFPGLPLSQLGQAIKCNARDGLVCLNRNQGLAQRCFDYEIRVLCCDETCGSIPTHTTVPDTTRVSSTSMSTSSSTSTPTVQSSTSTSISTTPTNATYTKTSSTSSPTSTPKPTMFSPSSGCVCSWSDWLDFGGPTTGPNGGAVIPIKKITDTYPSICKVPVKVECRAKRFPGLPLSQLGQTVKCNAKDGLICLNRNQGFAQRCIDYEIKVLCCDENCGSVPTHTPLPATTRVSSTSMSTSSSTSTSTVQSSSTSINISTTPTNATYTKTSSTSSPTSTTLKPTMFSPSSGCVCSWSDWLDFGGPTTGPNGGAVIPIKKITDTYPSICKVPVKVECRAKRFPGLPLSQLGQTPLNTCTTSNHH
nr:mucin-5AC [Misgurnus anguillicaudatus]